jgi:ornithine carbamoyltransferase
MTVRHFLTLSDLSRAELDWVLRRAEELKGLRARGERHESLPGKVLGMVFEKASTRTRVSFEVGMAQLGGHALFLSSRDTQLGRGEPIEDAARVLSRMLDIIMIRTHGHALIERFAAAANVPVINALTDRHHPCQLLADLQTYLAHRGPIAGRRVAWIGDGNNMCNSWLEAAGLFDFELRLACPRGFEPAAEWLALANGRAVVASDACAAAEGADLVVTDVWASMGQEEEQARRAHAFADYCVDQAVMACAAPDALFMHCLPAHRGEEVAAAVIDGPQSVVWDEAENRLHAQKALLEFLLLGSQPAAGDA